MESGAEVGWCSLFPEIDRHLPLFPKIKALIVYVVSVLIFPSNLDFCSPGPPNHWMCLNIASEIQSVE